MKAPSVYMIAVLMLGACNVVPTRDPTGEAFPNASGRTLAGEPILMRDIASAGPVILILPFTGTAESDRDSWEHGLLQLETPARVYELGVVPSTAGVILAPVINVARQEQRRRETNRTTLVFTGDGADAIATQTGMGEAHFARVLLVDRELRIVWFSAEGFRDDRLTDLDQEARVLALSSHTVHGDSASSDPRVSSP